MTFLATVSLRQKSGTYTVVSDAPMPLKLKLPMGNQIVLMSKFDTCVLTVSSIFRETFSRIFSIESQLVRITTQIVCSIFQRKGFSKTWYRGVGIPRTKRSKKLVRAIPALSGEFQRCPGNSNITFLTFETRFFMFML